MFDSFVRAAMSISEKYMSSSAAARIDDTDRLARGRSTRSERSAVDRICCANGQRTDG